LQILQFASEQWKPYLRMYINWRTRFCSDILSVSIKCLLMAQYLIAQNFQNVCLLLDVYQLVPSLFFVFESYCHKCKKCNVMFSISKIKKTTTLPNTSRIHSKNRTIPHFTYVNSQKEKLYLLLQMHHLYAEDFWVCIKTSKLKCDKVEYFHIKKS